MAKCKVCSSDLVDEINEKIIAGVSFIDISLYCKNQGFNCSHMSIKRHVDNGHVKRESTKDIADIATVEHDDPRVSVLQSVQVSSDEFNHFQNTTSNRLKRITILQLGIVEQKQIDFIRGVGRFPQGEIQALKHVIEMCQSLDLVKNHQRQDEPKQLDAELIQKFRNEIFGLSN